ncbi:MAG TPA: TIR domain-containing protein [Nevskiaceae bacterium]|nr:TIR domain-containing protein [Nevskiaceae bacterium]
MGTEASRTALPAGARYWAFISYSHADEAWARWLHRALERYRVPRHLRARGGAGLPARLTPVFRDREELSSAPELAAVIQAALVQSHSLIVIASPRAAASRWVNEEIRSFKRLGRESRIFVLIVDGDPQAGAGAGCLPPALIEGHDAQGRPDGRVAEPLAADVRPGRSRRHEALQQLVAGLLEVGLDELRQRERQRRRRESLGVAAAASLLLAAFLGLWQWQQGLRAREAERQLRERLFDAAGQALAEGRGAQAAALLMEALPLAGAEEDARQLLAQALPMVEAAEVFPPPAEPGHSFGQVALSGDGGTLLRLQVPTADAAAPGRLQLSRLDGGEPLELDRLPPSSSLVVSADGSRGLALIPAAAGAAEVRVYDLREGRQLLRATGGNSRWFFHSALLYFLADRELQRLATLDAAAAAQIWTVGEAAPRTLPGGPYLSLAMAPDGTRVVSADGRGAIQIWDARSGEPLRGFQTRPAGPSAAFFAGPSRVVTLGEGGAINLWDAERGEWLGGLYGHGNAVWFAQVSLDGRYLFTRSSEDPLRVWDLDRLRARFTSERRSEGYIAAGIDPSGRWFFGQNEQRTAIEVWELASGRRWGRLEGHHGTLVGLDGSADGQWLATAGVDGRVLRWRLAALRGGGVARLALPPPSAPPRHDLHWAGFADQGRQLLIAAPGPTVQRLRWPSREPLPALTAGSDLRTVSLSGDGRVLVGLEQAGALMLWPLDGSPPRRLALPAGLALQPYLAVDRTASRLASHADGQVWLWQPAPDEAPQPLGEPGEALWRLEFSPDDAELIGLGQRGALSRWSLDGRPRPAFTRHRDKVWNLAFHPDGGSLVSVGGDGRALHHDRGSGRLLQQLDRPGTALTSVAWVDARTVALGDDRGQLLLWRPQDGRLEIRSGLAPGISNDLALSPDRRLAVSPAWASFELGIWSLGSGRLLRRWQDPDGRTFSAVEIAPDGSALLASGHSRRDDHSLLLFDLAPERREVETLRRLAECRLPWLSRQGRLEPRLPDPLACAPPARR